MEKWYILLIITISLSCLWLTFLWTKLYEMQMKMLKEERKLKKEIMDSQASIGSHLYGLEKKIKGNGSDVAQVQWHFKSFQAKFLELDKKLNEVMKK
jgi:hypothetical protein